MRWALGGLLALVAAQLLPASQRGVQPETVRLRPDAGLTRVASLGRARTAATVLWMRTVLDYSGGDAHPSHVEHAVRTIGELDPTWTTPAVYGSLMLLSLGDVPGHQRALAAASEQYPDEPWFPSALALSKQYDSHEPQDALEWMRRAAALDSADPALARIVTRWAGEQL